MTTRDVPKEQKNRAFTLATDIKSVWFPQGGTRVAKVSLLVNLNVFFLQVLWLIFIL